MWLNTTTYQTTVHVYHSVTIILLSVSLLTAVSVISTKQCSETDKSTATTYSLVGVTPLHSCGGKPDGYIWPEGKATGGSIGGLVGGICSETGGDGRLTTAGLLGTVVDVVAVAI